MALCMSDTEPLDRQFRRSGREQAAEPDSRLGGVFVFTAMS